jgi:hypothetical protein
MTLYLNNDGSRWVDTDKRVMQFVLVLPDGTRKVRQARWYVAFGNFAAIAYSYRGKTYKALPKSASGYDTRLPEEDQRPHVFHKEAGQ